MSSIIDEELPLSLIARLSPLNPRQDMESDVSTLAATIRAAGLLHPILVRSLPGDESYEVLAGGRRWRALRTLGPEDRIVEARVFIGSEAEAREAALAEAVTQKPLHPVEEFEAFSDLENAGFDVLTIARDFALTERHVNQRLALGRLSPRVRRLWKEGKISRDLAEAFTAGTIEAQESLLDGAGEQGWTAYYVRKALRREAVEASEPLAKFILGERERRVLYENEGGRIEESLFSEETILLDRNIAQRVADRLLLATAERAAEAEGWGRASIEGGDDPDPLDIEPDYVDDEEERLDAIEAERRECHDPGRRAQLDHDAEFIERRALLRAVPHKDRAALGVRAELDSEGRIEIIRAVPLVHPEEEAAPDSASDDAEPRAAGGTSADRGASKPRERKEPEPAAIPPAPGGKEADAILADALGEALASVTARSLNLALALAVAALGCSHGRAGVGLAREIQIAPPPRHELLQRLAPMHFQTALAIVAQAPLADLSAAFAELVGRSISFVHLKPAQTQNFASLATRLVDLRGDLCDALDYKALFAASSREDALAAIRAIEGEAAANEAGKLRKPKIVERAALLARDRHWLPDAFATLFPAKPKDERSTAEAMVEAITRDEEKKASAEAKSADDTIALFLEECCIRGAEAGRVKAKALLDRFGEFAEARGFRKLTYADLSDALGALGLEKKRSCDGVHYLGLALRQDAETRQAAE